MTAKQRVTDQQVDCIKELHAQGLGRNAICRELQLSAGAVTKVCQELGLSFDRTATRQATEARAIDLAAAKQDRLVAEYEILRFKQERVLDVLHGRKPWRTKIKTAGGAEQIIDLDFIPSDDFKNEDTGRGAAARNIGYLEPKDTGDTSAAVDRWLEHMTGAIGAREQADTDGG